MVQSAPILGPRGLSAARVADPGLVSPVVVVPRVLDFPMQRPFLAVGLVQVVPGVLALAGASMPLLRGAPRIRALALVGVR